MVSLNFQLIFENLFVLGYKLNRLRHCKVLGDEHFYGFDIN